MQQIFHNIASIYPLTVNNFGRFLIPCPLGNTFSWKLRLVVLTRMINVLAVLLGSAAFGVIESQEINLQCVPLRDCPELFNLINKEQSLSEKSIRILETSHCGFVGDHPKVWCAVIKKESPEVNTNECRTARGEQGKCTPYKECKYFLRLLSSPNGHSSDTVYYLHKSQCSHSNTKNQQFIVCCPNEKFPLSTKYPNPTKLPVINRPNHVPNPSEGKCGQQILNKIIGGRITEPDEFPWTALLEYKSESKTSTACAGSLINDRYVVTAAHCVDNAAVRAVGKLTNVILGEFDTRTETDCVNSLGIEDCADPPVRIPIENIIVYPEWYKKRPAEINHDIALLRLEKKVTFTDYIQPICLPWPTLNVKEENFVVTGWGVTENGTASSVKLKTTLSMADRSYCVEKYRSDKKLIVGDGEMCVGGEEGKDSCSGDSGGPLMLLTNSNWYLAGIVSFGPNQPCGVKGYPGLYTFVPKYVSWIYKTLRP